MKHEILLEGMSIPCHIRWSSKARRLSLRLNHDGTIEAVVPTSTSRLFVESFIRSKQDWIQKTWMTYREKQSQGVFVRMHDGEQLPCFQERYILSVHIDAERKRSHMWEEYNTLHVEVNNQQEVHKVVTQWYKKKAKEYFVEQSLFFASRIGVDVVHVRVRDMKTRWGSAAIARKSLTYNWRLALAPEVVARYVVAHEVAHLKHADHSARFWKVVANLYPEYVTHRKWLKEFGFSLSLS